MDMLDWTLKKQAIRVVTTSPDNTEILCALGCIDQLAGVSKHCDYPEGIQDEKPVVSDFKTADVQAILALKPDVVFCSTFYQAEMVHELVKHHIRVVVTQPFDLVSVYDNIRLIGRVMERVERAETVIQQMQKAMVQQPQQKVRVFAEEWGNPIVVVAPWIQEMIRLAGGQPVFPELAQYNHTEDRVVTPEQVAEAQPDVVVLPWCGVHGKVPLDKVYSRPQWGKMPAVKYNRVYGVEDTFFVRPGPRLVQGYQQLVSFIEAAV